jgi:hypothetical protein
MTKPRTAAGRALLDALPLNDWHPINRKIVTDCILAIEAEAASPDSEALDVERLARALHAAQPHWKRETATWADHASVHLDHAAAIAAAYDLDSDAGSVGLDVEAAWAVGYYAGREDDEWQEPMDIERRAAEYARLRPHRPHIEALFASASERTEGGVA